MKGVSQGVDHEFSKRGPNQAVWGRWGSWAKPR